MAEPLPANMGLVPPRDGFLELLRERADATGALLVLDEVISGFRVARGGAQERFGVSADLTIMGKIIGGGLPAAAVGGRAELMRNARAPLVRSTRRARCRETHSPSLPGWRRSSCSTTPPTLRLGAITERARGRAARRPRRGTRCRS